MTVLQFRNASKEHAMGAVGVALGIAMVAVGNLIPSLSFLADGGNVLAIMSFIASLAKRGEKTAVQTAAVLDAKLDQRLAGQTNVIKDNTAELLNNLQGTTIETIGTVRKLETTTDQHAARLDAHEVTHAEHAAAISDHGEVLDNYGDHIKVMNDGLQRVAKETGVQYQPGGVLKARAKPA